MPSFVTGWLNAQNRGLLDWSPHGLIAYGCHSAIVVYHGESRQVFVVLQGHNNSVTQVCWACENFPHDLTALKREPRLASADVTGRVIVWDVNCSTIAASFGEIGRTVLCMKWLPWQDIAKDMLLCLHAPGTLVLWNAAAGTKIWAKHFGEPWNSFAFEHFEPRSIAFLSQNSAIMLLDDFSLSEPPSGSGKQFRFALPTSIASPDAPEEQSKKAMLAKNAKKLIPLVQAFVTGTSVDKSSAEKSSQGEECLKICFHCAVPDRLILVYSREVLFLDTRSLQTVATVTLDKTSSSFLDVLPCRYQDASYFVQENGCITLRTVKYRKQQTAAALSLGGNGTDVELKDSSTNLFDGAFTTVEAVYEGICSSEQLRVTKTYRVMATGLCPTFERRVVLLMSSGKLLFYELGEKVATERRLSFTDLVSFDSNSGSLEPCGKLKSSLIGVCSGLGSNPLVVRASPLHSCGHLRVAVGVVRNVSSTDGFTGGFVLGSSDGTIQLIDVTTGEIEKDFSIHNCPVRVLEWAEAHQIVSSGYSQALSASNVVRNELYITDILTGFTKSVRPEYDETPIEMVRVSQYSCYLAIAFRDQPLEIYDLKSFKLLRKMSKTCPLIVDMSWSCKHCKTMKVFKKTSNAVEDEAIQVLASLENKNQTVYRENLVVLDNENQIYHIVVKGMHVRDGKLVATQWATMGTITAMAWKDDILAFGDNDGRISAWDLGQKDLKSLSSIRSTVKRLQFSRVAEDYLMVVLHLDGISIWDMSSVTCRHTLYTRDLGYRAVDVDLCGLNSIPIVLTSDGILRIMDASLSGALLQANTKSLTKFFYPALLPPVLAFGLKLLLIEPAVRAKLPPGFGFAEILEQSDFSKSEQECLLKHLHHMDESAQKLYVSDACNALPRRAALVSRLFGDAWEATLWDVVDSVASGRNLPPSFGVLCDAQTFKCCELLRCSVFNSKRATYEQLNAHIERLILLRRIEEAVQLLLNTDASHPQYLNDCLKACLTSALSLTSSNQGTMLIKLVATNLISNGKISDGCLLLSLINLNADACKYLQSSNQWNKAGWLAKLTLDSDSQREVLKKWADNMCSVQKNQKTAGILLFLHLLQLDRVVEKLCGWKQFHTSAWLIQTFRGRVTDDLIKTVNIHFAKELEGVGLTRLSAVYRNEAENAATHTE